MSWEPPHSSQDWGQLGSEKTVIADLDENDNSEDPILDYTSHCFSAEQRVHECTACIIRYSLKCPHSNAGAVVSFVGQTVDNHYSSSLGSCCNPWTPFTSEIDWKIAYWVKMCGPGSTVFSDLLSINGVSGIIIFGKSGWLSLKVCEALNLSYKNSNELNKIIDSSLPSRPRFKCYEVVIAGETLEFYARDIVECLKVLWADPDFLPFLVFEPEEHYADDDHTVHIFHDMHTWRWWWNTQVWNLYDMSIVN